MRRVAQVPSAPPLLGEIDVWCAQLDQHVDSLSELTNVLSPDELERAARFRFTRDRNRFVLSRGLLRTILSLYHAVDPNELRFSYGPFNKPFLDSRWHQTPLSFNVAHAGQMALYAFTSRSTVGVDVEFVEPLLDLDGVARQFFSYKELDRLHRLSNDQRLLAFFKGWTRKEAYLKARGQGLTRSPHQVEVSLEPFRSSVLDTVDSEEGPHRSWRIETVFPAPGYVGAVAAEGDDWRIRWLDWQTSRALLRPRQMEYS